MSWKWWGKENIYVKRKRSWSFDLFIFRSDQPDWGAHHARYVAMTSTYKQHILVWLTFASAAGRLGSVQNVTVLGTNYGITYELWSVNSIRWWCWNIASDKRDYFSVKVKVRIPLSIISIRKLRAHLDRCDVDNHRIENCSVTEHHLYNGSWK